jgi:hypothetical protein
MAKRSQGWVKCEDRLPYYKDNSCSLSLATTPRLRLHDSRGPRRGRPGSRARSSGALGASMQHEGPLFRTASFQKKNDTRIASLDLSTAKHLKLLAPATLKSVLKFCSLIASRQAIFSTTNLQPTARRSTASLFFPPVSVFDHFAGLALPAPHSGWSTPMPHCSLFYLQLPPPCSPPPLPPPSHCLTTSRCLRRQLFPTFADNNKSFNHTA